MIFAAMFEIRAFVAFLLLVGAYGNLIPEKSDSPISTNLKVVATADGKSFFADRSYMRTWRNAEKYCNNLGMQLAEITSKAQENALRAAYGPDFEWGFWINARDAHSHRQFSWNSNGAAISSEYLPLRNRDDMDYQTCLTYWSRANNDSALYQT